MKNLALSLMAVALLFAGCKKQSTAIIKPPVKTTLLSKETFVEAGKTYVDTYTYDDKNRLIDLNAPWLSFDYKYTYDDKDNLLTATVYDHDNVLQRSAKYAYSGNTMVVTEYDDQGTLQNTHNWTLNAAKLVNTDTDMGTTLTYYYNSAGNVTGWTGSENNYTYDSKKHPLSMVTGINYHLMYFGYYETSSFLNNAITDKQGNETITYTYNTDGFPVTANVVKGAITYTISFEYIVK